MTPEILTRSFSNDQYVFDNVFFSNYYKIKGDKSKQRVIVDIGAHAGYFSFLSLSLGAKKVYCFEPFIDSFSVLLKNVYNPNFSGRVTPYQLGVYTSEMLGAFTSPKLVEKIYLDFASIALSTENNDNPYPCFCSTLDNILYKNCFNENIDILKINIGYAEREILLQSSLIQENVNSICGEISCQTENQLVEFKKEMGIKGFANFVSSQINDSERCLVRMTKNSFSEYFIE